MLSTKNDGSDIVENKRSSQKIKAKTKRMENHGSQSLAITCKICSADPKIYSAVFIVAPPTTLKSRQSKSKPTFNINFQNIEEL